MSVHQHSSTPAGPTNGDAVHPAVEAARRDWRRRYGNRFLLEPAPDNELPEHGMRAVDAMRLIGEELVLDGIPHAQPGDVRDDVDGARGAADHRREPAPQLHRPRRVSADGRDRAALHPHARDLFHAPGETTGARTQGSSEAIMLGALSLKWKWRQRREAARQGHEPAEPRLRRRRARRVGEVLPLLRRRAADHPAAARQVHDRPRGRRAPRRREHDRRRGRARHDVHRPRRRRPRHQRPARAAARREGHRRPAARRRRQRRLRVAVPVPGLRVGLPARAGALDQRLRAQVRARLPGHRLADLPRAERPRRGPRLLRELPRQDATRRSR